MAYEGVNNYCHSEYDWSVAKENPSIMCVEMGEETDSAYQVIFRSYTGGVGVLLCGQNKRHYANGGMRSKSWCRRRSWKLRIV